MMISEKDSPAFPFRSLRIRAIWALSLIGIFIAVALAGTASSLAQYDLLQRAAMGELVTDAEGIANDRRQAAIGVIYLVAIVGVIITFLMWINRASKNLSSLGIEKQRFSPGEAVGWWFCPIANLWQPFRVTVEIWRGSHPSQPRTSPFLWIWWITWLIANVAGYLQMMASCNMPYYTSIDQLKGLSVIFATFYIIVSVAGIMLFVVVMWITANQGKKHATMRNMTVDEV